ncbi:hypothetical protein VTI28DRAFT_7249 [Corynascus sepedonium]
MGATKDCPPPSFTTVDDTSSLDIPRGDPPPYEPPAYESCAQSAAPDPDEVLDPCTLVLRGRAISPAATTADLLDLEPAPTYMLTNPIHVCGIPAGQMVLQRMDPRVRTAATDGSPFVSFRPKDVYRLGHRKPLVNAGIPFEAWLEPLTRKALGTIRIERSPGFHTGYRALRVRSDAEIRALTNEGVKIKKGEYWFVLRDKGSGKGVPYTWEWSDNQGRVVAKHMREERSGSSEAGAASAGAGAATQEFQEVHSLKVLEPLSRRERDSLVALWCLWMWHLHIQESTPKKTWEDRKRIMQKPRNGESSWYI